METFLFYFALLEEKFCAAVPKLKKKVIGVPPLKMNHLIVIY